MHFVKPRFPRGKDDDDVYDIDHVSRPKGLHIVRLFETVLDKEGLDHKRAQCLIEHGGELQSDLREVLEKHAVVNRFSKKESCLEHVYPEEYKGPKPIEKQIEMLAEVFCLDPVDAFEFAKKLPDFRSFVPEGAWPWVGWFAIPSVDGMARWFFPKIEDPEERYCCAVQVLQSHISLSRPLGSYKDGPIDPRPVIQNAKTAKSVQYISDIQKGSEIFLIPAQFGMFHRGRMAPKAFGAMNDNEFGLRILDVSAMLLTHPERLQGDNDLWIDCSDQVSDIGDGQFNKFPYFTPYYYFSKQTMRFNAHFCEDNANHCGLASGFIPQ